jgi:hypothetical protein
MLSKAYQFIFVVTLGKKYYPKSISIDYVSDYIPPSAELRFEYPAALLGGAPPSFDLVSRTATSA